jgi:outer membrane protein OmpA-like peptidoglycan-associated protein
VKTFLLSIVSATIILSGCSNKNEYRTIHSKDNNSTQKVDVNNPSEINHKDFIDELALHDAIRARDIEHVKFLIEEGSDLNTQDIYGYTPVHLASRLQELEILTLLLEHGANVNNTDIYKDTPLLDSTRNNYTKISELLICNGAHRNVEDTHEMSPLHNSSKNKNLYISRMLLAKDLTPYCKKLGVKIVDLDKNGENYKVCGVYKNDINASNTLDIADKTGTLIDSVTSQEKWCSDFAKLNDGSYRLNANAQDIYERNATDLAMLDINGDITELYTNRLKITIDDIDNFDTETKTICGTVAHGKATKVDLNLYNVDTDTKYGAYKTNIIGDRWCSEPVTDITYGHYEAKAKGIDDYNNSSVALDDTINYIPEKFAITIDTIPDQNDTTVQICGDIPKGDAKQVTVNLVHNNDSSKSYKTAHDNKQKRWCTAVINDLEEGNYTAHAKGFSTNNIPSDAKEDFNVKLPEPEAFIGLYDALYEEFKDDFGPWNAELTKDDLLFRFKDPASLFTHGNSDLKDRFTNILSDFFPRYLKIINGYQKEIEEVAIEGHTSSSYRLAKNDEERWQFNKNLSDKRANEVRDYSVNVAATDSQIDQEWIADTFKPYGRSYDNLIYNLDGSENADASRRVEFKIIRKNGVAPVMKKVE